MNEAVLRAYDATRDLSDKSFRSVCYAPFISLYFDTLGNVRVCCQNTMHLVGNVAESSIDEIWRGEKIRQLRQALIDYDFRLGCRFCEWQLKDGDYATSFMRSFDEFPVQSEAPEWPVRMEFSVSNTCNLECVMCNGEWSSSIRSRREKLPPLPKAYDERFFTDIRKYLPHLKHAKFLGGEPFLAAESLRVWTMMVDDGLDIPCHVTTNGTQYNAKVERILENLPVSFSISMDGVTKQTVEGVRVNAHFETVLENFKRFHAYARRRGTYIGMTFCLMQKNWHEFGDYLLFADAWDCEVVVNTVIQPLSLSLHVLPPEELAEVVRKMEDQGSRILPKLGRNRQVWIDQLERLRQRLGTKGATDAYFVPLKLTETFVELETGPLGPPADAMDEAQARRRLAKWARNIKIDGWLSGRDKNVLRTISGGEDLLGVPADRVVGKPVDRVNVEFMKRYGEKMEILKEDVRPHFTDKIVALTIHNKTTTYLRSINFPRYDERGAVVGSMTLAAVSEELPSSRTRLCDSFTDRGPAGAAEPETMSERRAASILRRWARASQVERLVSDEFDEIVPDGVGGGAFFGVPAGDLVGRTIDEAYAQMIGRFGAAVNMIKEDRQPRYEDRILQFVAEDGKSETFIRFFTLPRYDETGRVVGCLTLAVAAPKLPTDKPRLVDAFCDRDELEELGGAEVLSDAAARALLAEFSEGAPVDWLRSDEEDRVDGVGPNGFLGVAPDECRGKTIDQLYEQLMARLGRDVQFLGDERRPAYTDRTVSFLSPDGARRVVRSITIPEYAPDGRVVGCRTFATLQGARAAASVAEPSGQEPPPANGGPRLFDIFAASAENAAGATEPMTEGKVREILESWASGQQITGLVCDGQDLVQGALGGEFLGIEPGEVVGRPVDEVYHRLRRRFGENVQPIREDARPAFIDRLVAFSSPDRKSTFVRAITIPKFDAKGKVEGTLTLASSTDRPPQGP